jgi:hypothetical protein
MTFDLGVLFLSLSDIFGLLKYLFSFINFYDII